MRKLTVPMAAAAAAVVLTLAVTSMTSKAADASYAEDRAAIEDLQARYLFAMDFGDPDLYVTMFTEDGILDVGSGEIRGRKPIRDVIAKMPNSRTSENGLRPASGRRNIWNIVLKVNGNKAVGRAYWFHYSNNDPGTEQRVRRLRPLRRRDGEGERPVVLHQAADLQRAARRVGTPRRQEPGVVTRINDRTCLEHVSSVT